MPKSRRSAKKTVPAAVISPKPSGYRMFTDAQLDEIHLATLEILRRTGVRVHEAESLDLLAAAGCTITDGNLVRFQPSLLEDALTTAPSRVVMCGRDSAPRMYLESHRTYFGTGSDLPNTRDLDSGERRLSRLDDVEKAARLADSLPNIDFIMSMALPSDVAPELTDRYAFRAMVENSVKPILYTAWDEHGTADIIRMAEAIAGGPEELALNPFLMAYLEPSSPLQHSEVVLRKMLKVVDHGLPLVYSPGPVDGASAPVTGAGALAMTNAEVLSGLAIAQLRRKGTPFVWGAGSGPMDMKSTVATYGSPEFLLHAMGMAELARYYYNVPVWGFSGCSDSKIPDMQAGIESALWILWTALSGANLIHDVGYIESGLTCSWEMVVISDEIISFVRRLMAGMQLTPETFALHVIDEVGPGGNYLTHEHTTAHFREIWYPRVFDRRMYGSWVAKGAATTVERARELARQAIATHQPPPVPAGAKGVLDDIVAEAQARYDAGK